MAAHHSVSPTQFGQSSLFNAGQYTEHPNQRAQRTRGQLFDTTPYDAKPPTATPATSAPGGMGSDARTGLPNQPQMLMTPREIHAQYQPLDADRQENYDEGMRTRTTQWTHQGSTGYGWTPGGREYERSVHPPEPVNGAVPKGAAWEHRGKVRVRDETMSQESDQQLWDRKYDEATYSPKERAEEYGGETPATKYVNRQGVTTDRSGSFRRRGDMPMDSAYAGMGSETASEETFQPHAEHPTANESLRTHLLSGQFPGTISLGRTMGSKGKPEIVGGHHRLSVMTEHKPDLPLPVSHWEGIHQAKSSRSYT